MYDLIYTDEAKSNLAKLKKQGQIRKLKKIKKTLDKLKENPRHPSLKTHKYQLFNNYNNEEIFEAYAENNTPAAYRIFWHYGPNKDYITILSITPHP